MNRYGIKVLRKFLFLKILKQKPQKTNHPEKQIVFHFRGIRYRCAKHMPGERR
jgi:hypothetical protein